MAGKHLTTRLRDAIAALAVTCGVAACQDPSAVVKTREQAIAIAKIKLGDTLVRGRPLSANRYRGDWIVRVPWRPGDPTEEVVLIDAHTGKAERSSVQTGVVYVNAPPHRAHP